MKNKVIKIFVGILISLICVALLNNSYAGSVCIIDATPSKGNLKPGQEIDIDISTTYIHEGIAGIGFFLDYDENKFDFISATTANNWTSTQIENSFTILTSDYEPTTDTGKIITLKLKAKDNATPSTSSIKLTHVQATTDDALVEELADITKDITIVAQEQPQKENTTGGNTTGGNTAGGNTTGGNTAGGNNDRPGQNTNGGWWSSDSIDESKIVTINGNSSGAESAKGSDASTSSKSLPKTGYRSIIILGIALTITGMVTSYTLFKKYKNI